MKKVNKFAGVAKRIAEIKSNVGSYAKITESDVFDALVLGCTYRNDVVSTYENEEKVQDKVSFIFGVEVEDGKVATLRKEYTVSAYSQAKLPPMLEKFDLEIETFYEMMGKTLRLNVEMKKSKAGKEYANIESILVMKKSGKEIDLWDDVSVPYFFVEGCDEEQYDFLEGVEVSEEPKDDKPKRKLKKIEPVEEEDLEDDDFFDDLDS